MSERRPLGWVIVGTTRDATWVGNGGEVFTTPGEAGRLAWIYNRPGHAGTHGEAVYTVCALTPEALNPPRRRTNNGMA